GTGSPPQGLISGDSVNLPVNPDYPHPPRTPFERVAYAADQVLYPAPPARPPQHRDRRQQEPEISTVGRRGSTNTAASAVAAIIDQDRHVVAAHVGHSEVKCAVAGEVPDRYADGTCPRIEIRGRPEAAGAGAQQDRHIVGGLLRHGQVELPVAVEVPNRHGEKKIPHIKIPGRPEAAGTGA